MKASFQDGDEDFVAEGAVGEVFGMELYAPEVSFPVMDDFRSVVGCGDEIESIRKICYRSRMCFVGDHVFLREGGIEWGMNCDGNESFLFSIEHLDIRTEFVRDELATEADADERSVRLSYECPFLSVRLWVFRDRWHIASAREDDDIIVTVTDCFEIIPVNDFRLAGDERAELVEVLRMIVDDECFFHNVRDWRA